MLKAINLAIYFMSSKLILFACFVTYIYLEGPLDAKSIFFSMAYFNTLRITVSKNYPNSMAAIAEVRVTCKRIETVLLREEVDIKGNKYLGDSSKDASVTLKGATAKWSEVCFLK